MAYSDESVFSQIFAQLTGIDLNQNPWVSSLYNTAKNYVDSGMITWNDPQLMDLLLTDTKTPELQPFRDRFSYYLKQRSDAIAAGTTPQFGSLSDYMQTERAYVTMLNSKPGFGDLATADNIRKFLENNTSIDEISARIDNAFYIINTADQALKDQLAVDFPMLSPADLARAMVTGDTTAAQQKVKIGAADIRAGAQMAGMQFQTSSEELAKMGITREKAQAAATSIMEQKTGIAQASQMFGGGLTDGDLQKQIEEEQLLGKAAPTAKRLRSQARAQFAGTSGITTGSLSRKKQV